MSDAAFNSNPEQHSAQELLELRRQLRAVQERDNLLASIDKLGRTSTDPAEVTTGVATLVGLHLKVHRCVFAEIQDDENTFRVTGSYTDGLDPLPDTFKISDFSEPLQKLLSSGGLYIVDDTETDPLSADSLDVYRLTGLRATISIPLMKDGHLRGALAVHHKSPRHWTQRDISLLISIAARCWETTERLRAIHQLQAERDALIAKTAEVERQRAEIASIYQTAPIGLAQFDLDDYHYVRLNDHQAAFFGLKPEDVLGRTLTEMAPVPGLRELFDQVAAGGSVVNYPLEGTLISAPDDYRYWTVSYYPIRGEDGAITGITAASLEITPQKRAELALIQSEKLAAVGRLAASIAHEINNPLEAVTNLLYLAATSKDIEEIHKFLAQADTELRRMTQITNQTLRFHRQSTRPTEASAQELFESTLGIYHAKLINARTRVDTEIATKKTVLCFEGEIRQVLSNLIGNALDAMPSRGLLRVRAREGTDWRTGRAGMIFTIADDGPGIPASIRERIFEPFFSTKGSNGTGLGLWVSSEIVTRHHGRLRVRSCEGPQNHGTVFTLFLPFDAASR